VDGSARTTDIQPGHERPDREQRHDEGSDRTPANGSGNGDEPSQRADEQRGPTRLWRAGRTAWALVGIALAVAVLGLIAGELTLVIVPAVLALFPATLLVPVASWLQRRKVPDALAGLITIVAGIALIAGVIGAMVPLVANQAPELVESASEGVAELEELLQDGILGFEAEGIEELLESGREQLGEAGDLAGQAAGAAFAAFEVIAGLLLLVVALFFYLKDGRRLGEGIITTFPPSSRERVRKLAYGSWDTLGRYFRGQLLVAFVDAVLIGIGLVILGVPLALPLAVLIFFGGLFPIVGAVATGGLAVLVALADGGLTTGLIVLAIVIAVQQAESNILEPLILGRVIALHPLVIILSITAGSLALGILGAFLAVPVAAIVARVIDELREDTDGPDDDGDEEGGDERDDPDDDTANGSNGSNDEDTEAAADHAQR
jgi:predicted PurR-regulated permease PerM